MDVQAFPRYSPAPPMPWVSISRLRVAYPMPSSLAACRREIFPALMRSKTAPKRRLKPFLSVTPWAADSLALSAGSVHTRFHPLSDQLEFELSQGPQHVHE